MRLKCIRLAGFARRPIFNLQGCLCQQPGKLQLRERRLSRADEYGRRMAFQLKLNGNASRYRRIRRADLDGQQLVQEPGLHNRRGLFHQMHGAGPIGSLRQLDNL